MYLLHHAKKVCSSTESYVQALTRIRHVLCYSEYLDLFVNNTIKKFEKRQSNSPDKYETDIFFTIRIPFFEKAS